MHGNNNEVVVNPAIGTTFDSLQEQACYLYYKFYSWAELEPSIRVRLVTLEL